MIAPPIWYYGYSSMSLEAALKVNGYDERFDGSKSLEDCDCGNRLSMAGYTNVFLLDVNHWVIEHEHESLSRDVVAPSVEVFKCNYGLYLLNKERNRWRANSDRLSLADCQWGREKICPRCDNYQRCLGEELEGKFYSINRDFDLWFNHQPVFDLREERLSI